MDSWGKPSPRPNPSGVFGSATDNLATDSSKSSAKSSADQKRPYHRQEHSETKSPVISNTTPSPQHAIPPPPLIPNTPAPWQLGRHSQYISRTGYYQHPPRSGVQPILGSAEGYGDGKWGPERVQHQLMNDDEAGLRDVEEELHRALQARQVRLLSFLSASFWATRLTPLKDFNDRTGRDNRYRFSHWNRDGFKAR
jgi:hypothetical protein